jgi:hypothetical protein
MVLSQKILASIFKVVQDLLDLPCTKYAVNINHTLQCVTSKKLQTSQSKMLILKYLMIQYAQDITAVDRVRY